MYKPQLPLASKWPLMLLLILTACAPQTATPETSASAAGTSFCQIAKVITFDRRADTLQTIEQIKEHNAVFDKLCGGGTQ